MNYELFYNIYIVIIVIGILSGIFKFKELSKSSKFFLALLIITLITEKVSEFYASNTTNNSFIFHFYAPISYSLIGLAYFTEGKNILIIWSIFIVTTFSIINMIYWESQQEFNSNVLNIITFFSSILCVSYLRALLKSETENSFSDYPLFWFSCGILLFNVANSAGLGLMNFLDSKQNEVLNNIFIYIRFATNYIQYCIFIVAFQSRQKTLVHSQ